MSAYLFTFDPCLNGSIPLALILYMHFEHVLLIDDDPIYNLIHERILHHTTMVTKMKSVSSGQEGIAYLEDFFKQHSLLPGIILLDLDMPVMDGFQFIEVFRKMDLPGKEDVAIIMVTSSDHPHDRAKAMQYGIQHYLIKPVEVDIMNKTLASLRKTGTL